MTKKVLGHLLSLTDYLSHDDLVRLLRTLHEGGSDVADLPLGAYVAATRRHGRMVVIVHGRSAGDLPLAYSGPAMDYRGRWVQDENGRRDLLAKVNAVMDVRGDA